LIAAVFFLITAGTGTLVLKAVGFRAENGAGRLVFSFAAGSVVFSLVLLGAGKLGFLGRPQVLALTAVFVAVSLFGFKRTLQDIAVLIKGISSPVKGIIMAALAMLFLGRVLYAFFNSFVPPQAWDTLAYHYAIPALYKSAGSVFYIPHMFHSNWPQNMEMAFSWAMIIDSDIAANAVSFVYSLMLLACVYALASRQGGPAAGFIAAAVVSATVFFKQDSSNGYVDTGLAFFEAAAFLGFLAYMKDRDNRYAAVSGICAAGAASVKILGLFSCAFLPFFFLFTRYLNADKERKPDIKAAVIFASVAALFASAWYVKSAIDTGNPVWPFAYKLFGGINWTEELGRHRAEYYASLGGGKGFLNVILMPLKLIQSGNMDGFVGNNMLFFYAMLPFALRSVSREKDRMTAAALVYGLVFYLFWTAGTFMTRFLYPGLVVFMAVASAEAARLLEGRHGKIMKYACAAILLYLMIFSYPVRNPAKITGLNFFLGLVDREEYLEKNQDNYRLYKRVNNDAAIDGRIVLFREIRGYYLEKDYIWGDPVNQGIISYISPEKTLYDLEKNGVKFIIYNNRQQEDGSGGYGRRGYEIMRQVAERYGKLIYCEGTACIYRLKSYRP